MKKRKKSTTIILISFALVCILFGCLFIFCFSDTKAVAMSFDNAFSGKVGQTSLTLGTVERNIPTETSNEGLNSRYPTYGTSLSGITDEEKDNLLQETSLIIASSSSYDSMDEQGNLYLNGVATGKKLYKHISSVGMYYGDVSDDEPAVVEQITITPTEERNYITGLYAPAGEVVKIEISEEDLTAIGGELTVSVGQVSHKNIQNNIWKARNDFSRMPKIGNILSISTTTAYVGNCLGGPIYLYPKIINKTFTVKISGAVKYAYYIHGYTTKAQVEEMKQYTAPYYDFEVWDLGVRHSGPSLYGNYDYDNLIKVGDLWEKICRTSRQVPCSANASIEVGFIYDCFVAAGAAVAFQGGASWVNAPCAGLSGALDYQSMTSNGFWGIIHEFNHLYQSYGMYETKSNEVTNNATSLLSYVLYTNISAKRSESDSTLTDWNRYTDPSRSLRETIANAKGGEAQFALNCYADIIHSFGTDVYTYATRIQKKFGVDGWYEALSIATGYNMTFYFEEMLNQTISEEYKALYDSSDKTTFVPIASLYQTGRNYFVGDEEVLVETVRPFEIEKGQEYTLDFNTYLIIPDGFDFEIKRISQPQSGEIQKQSNNVYVYTPGENELSGNFEVVVQLKHDTIATKDITLTINLKQRVSNTLNVTRYIYSSRVYNSVQDAIDNNFEGYESVSYGRNTTTFLNHIANNCIGIVEGKIFIPEDGEYAICLRSGRGNNTLYLSVNDGENLSEVLNLNTDHVSFATDGDHVVKLQLKAGDYVYFKEITLSKHGANDAFTELGWANLTKSATSVTIPSQYLYNNEVFNTPYSFDSQEKYARKYQASILINKSDVSKQNIISVNHSSWDSDKNIDNILDGSLETFYHNNINNFVSESNPFILEVDLGEELLCNKITIITRTSGQYNLPSTFKLYGGTDLDNMELLGDYSNLSLIGNTVQATFDDSVIRYYKLYVTDTKSISTGNKYVTIAQIDFSYTLDGEEKSPFEFTYFQSKKTGYDIVKTTSTFGRILKGNGKIEYNFTGSNFALLVLQDNNCTIKVTLDGVCQTISLNKSIEKQIAFAQLKLEDKNHDITIEVISGSLCVDSIVVG